MAHEVVVVGGGIAGLSCAFRLQARGVDVVVVEAEKQAGGNVRTESAEGFRIERGPHTFLPSAEDIFDLAREAGLESEIVVSRPSAKKRFIVRNGKLHKVFTGPGSFLTSRLLSFRGKLKLIGEPFRTRRRGQPTDSAATFFERRFGPEASRILAGAFISGVYAGDPATLSAPAAFPLFWGFEQETGSMIRGAMRHRKRIKAEREARGEARTKPPKGLCSFRTGLGQLTAALADRLGDRCRTGSPVLALDRGASGYQVRTGEGELTARQVVLAVPPGQAANLLGGLDSIMAEEMAAIPMAPMVVVHMGHRQRAEGVPDGFGFLAPRDQGVRTLGVLFPCRLFEDRTPEGGDLLTGFVGGMLDPGALDLPDEEVTGIVRKDLQRLTGFSAAPSFVRVARYPHAIPQFVLGHATRMEKIQARRKRLPGLTLAGNYLRGVGMKDAVGSGFEAAREVLSRTGQGGKE